MIAERIEADRQAGGAYGDHAVLVSGNDRLADIARELEALGIPVLFLGSLFERSEIKDLLCLLSVATDPWAAGLLRLACMPEFRMDLASVVEAQAALKARPRDSAWPLLDPDTATTLSPSGAKGLRALAHCLKGVRYESDPWEVLARILFDRTRIAARHAQGKSAADRTCAIAIWQFMNFV
jgi:superfamily I DNA/RNA helicase